MKLCVIGGAGARSAFLTKSLVKSTRDIRVDHIVLLDNDQQKLKTYGRSPGSCPVGWTRT
ncbi:MAG: hypothetical protein ACLUIW_03455 [Dysosmobacter welbionis]